MKNQKENRRIIADAGAHRRHGTILAAAFIGTTVILSCSLLGGAQPSAATQAPATADTGITNAPPTAAPATNEPPDSAPGATKTRKPTRTATEAAPQTAEDIFDQYAENAGMTPQEARDFYYRIIDCITNDKRDELAGMVRYPIDVFLGATKTTINNQAQLLQHYDQIINQTVRDAARDQTPEDLHVNYQGIGFTHGEIWYGAVCDDAECKTYQVFIIAINNYSGV